MIWKKVKNIIGIFFRFLMGAMWFMSALSWFRRTDSNQFILDAIATSMEQGKTLGFYQPFLVDVVTPNITLFAWLVSLGELLVGISLLSGTVVKVGSVGAVFLLLNYSFMNGSLFHLFNLCFVLIHVFLFISEPGRIFGGDKILHKKWPGVKIF